jgi:dUTP pyrophosphatase
MVEKLSVKVVTSEGAELPEYRSPGAAGADIRARIDEDILIRPGERVAVPTGLSVQIPEGWEAQVRTRSGLALERGIVCLNSPGTVDSDYRGEVKVILANFGSDEYTVRDGARIAQIVFARCGRADFDVASQLESSERGSGGFGSTGI